MTALQQLIKIIKQKRKESEISNTLLKFVQFKAEMLLKTEKEKQDDFAIGFAEWSSYYRDKNKNYKGEMLHAISKYDESYTTKELLEIYKKEII